MLDIRCSALLCESERDVVLERTERNAASSSCAHGRDRKHLAALRPIVSKFVSSACSGPEERAPEGPPG
jgi:hypothetical protein